MMFMWLIFLDLSRWLQETTSHRPINNLYSIMGAFYVPPPPPPPFLSFNEIPKYRGIDNLNTTLHLIKNKFIKKQHKTVFNIDGTTNKFTTNLHKTGLNFDCITNLGRFLTNNFTINQQIITNQQTVCVQSFGRRLSSK